MRATLVISSLDAGGAERVLTLLANQLTDRGWQISVISQRGRSAQIPFFPIDPRVAVQHLDFDQIGQRAARLTGKLQQLLALRAAIRASGPDVVLSFMDTVNVRTLLATRGLGIPVVVAERADPSVRRITRNWEMLRRWTYPWASAIAVQSPEVGSYFSWANPQRCHLIPNPVLPPPSVEPDANRTGRTVITLGRLQPVKGFDRLLQAFALMLKHHPQWRLELWGDGPDRGRLETIAQELGINDKVTFCGQTSEPHRRLMAADIFAMSSHTEGFPMALGEAMSCGLACVSFDCPSGPRQLIKHDTDGLLVPNGDILALASALSKLAGEPATRQRLGAQARGVVARFALSTIVDKWEQVLRSVSAAGHRSMATPISQEAP